MKINVPGGELQSQRREINFAWEKIKPNISIAQAFSNMTKTFKIQHAGNQSNMVTDIGSANHRFRFYILRRYRASATRLKRRFK